MNMRINFIRLDLAALAMALSTILSASLLSACGGGGSAPSAPKLAAGALQQPGPSVPAEGELLPFTTIGSDHAAFAPRNLVIRDNAAWTAFWQADQAGLPAPAPLPQIDFSSKMVVAVYAPGDSCTHLSIGAVRVKSKRLTVEYSVTPPAPNVLCIASIALPRQLIVIDKLDLPLVFANTGSGEVEASFQTLAASSYTGVAQARNAVARDAASWAALWADYIGKPSINTTVLSKPDVDFSKYMVVAVFGGSENGPCQNIAVERVDERAGQLQVNYVVTTAGPATTCLAAVIAPGQLILVPYSEGAVQFLAKRVQI